MKYNKTTKDNELAQKEKAELRLAQLLDTICRAADIQIVEWDFDKELFVAIIGSSKQKLDKAMTAFTEYDECYMLFKDLGIAVDAKYRWFTNIKEHIQ